MTDATAARRVRAVDAHVHFWNPAALQYPWLNAAPALQRAFLPQDYEPTMSDGVGSVIFVEANCRADQAAAEVAMVGRLRDTFPWIAGLVAFVDLSDESACATRLNALAEMTGIVGVRHNIQGQAAGFCVQPAFVRGVREVGECGLVFDLCATSHQLTDVVELVAQCPHTQFVLDHCGKPDIAHDEIARWSASLRRIANYPNVACKVSGLFTEARPDQRTLPALHPYLQHARDCFGAARLIYGSDWPVVGARGDADTWREITDAFTAAWPPADREAFYAENATRIYGLR